MTDAPKTIRIGVSAVARLLGGMRILAETVAVTLGPRGRHVIIEQASRLAPRITKDGVTVARALALADPEAEAGLRLLRQAAETVSVTAGDGTTTTILLGYALAAACQQARAAGIDPIALREALAAAARVAFEALSALAEPANADDLHAVACAAANGDSAVAAMLLDAFRAVGPDGLIDVELGDAVADQLEVKRGIQFETLALLRDLLPPVGALTLREPLILLYDRTVERFEDLVPALEAAVAAKRPLLLLADDLSEPVRLGLVENNRRDTLRVAAIKPPMHGETRLDALVDVATMCRARAVLARDGGELKDVTARDLGGADEVSLTASSAVIAGARGDPAAIGDRIALLRGELAAGDGDSLSPTGRADFLDKRTDRLKLLLGVTAVLKVGGQSDAEIRSRLPLIENARRAMAAAADSGVLPGGGVAFLRVAAVIESEGADATRAAAGALRRALAAPARRIARNAGQQPENIVARILANADPWFGFDAREGVYGDLRAAGVVDTLEVMLHSIHVAVSIAGSLLSTGVLISQPPRSGTLELSDGAAAVHRNLLREGALDS
jgi:chaperonin GroEL